MWRRSLFVAIPWLAILLATSGNFFFWDTVQLSSKQAHFFYENDFQYFFLPAAINSGHPPFYGIALAFFWKLFGYTLLTSHFFNGLFVLASIYQAHLLGSHFLGKKMAFFFPLVLFCNPIFLGHSVLVSPDNALLFFLLFAVNSLLRKKWKLFMIAVSLLALVSMRGMMCVFALFLGNLILSISKGKSRPFSEIRYFLPAGILAFTFFLGHYMNNQWIGFHSDSPWQESFNIVSLRDYIKNLLIIAWRIIDFGNIFLLAGIAFFYLKKPLAKRTFGPFLPFLIALLIVFVLPLAAFKYLSAHRYFMPIYLLFTFTFAVIIVREKAFKIGGILLLLLFLGNWWIYPRSISQGWDVSLGHLPIYDMVDEMNEFVQSSDIASAELGSEFPMKSDAKILYLDSEKPSYKEARVGESRFILYSRIINDYKIEDFQKLEAEYNLIKEINHLFIDLKLYERSPKIKTRGTESD